MNEYGEYKTTLESAVEQLVIEDPRYAAEAYFFVRDGFDYARENSEDFIMNPDSRKQRPLSGAELARGLKDFALDEYGPMAAFTLAEWGIKTTNDFGEIVFNLVKIGFIAKNKGDARSDFDNVFDLQQALRSRYE